RQLPSEWSIKDVMAHLMTWQQRSIARLEAALYHRVPEFPRWPENLHPDSDDEPPDQINAWIYDTNRDRPWASVYRDWREGFLRFLELGEAIPENDLLEVGKYPWMEGYPLSLVLLSSYEHHHIDHLEPLLAWLRQHGDLKALG
ncbi:MAG TPA: ClbS/DfsB family four-helix bundle protein, partial [Anaerolineales bacterium]